MEELFQSGSIDQNRSSTNWPLAKIFQRYINHVTRRLGLTAHAGTMYSVVFITWHFVLIYLRIIHWMWRTSPAAGWLSAAAQKLHCVVAYILWRVGSKTPRRPARWASRGVFLYFHIKVSCSWSFPKIKQELLWRPWSVPYITNGVWAGHP